ncbi:MAG: hypothetical protein JSU63_01900 [Phycisphaerales bacterium]|nr:MAG: hypothetical protein JSU63_01900 [Phycisphaerales bacterium]
MTNPTLATIDVLHRLLVRPARHAIPWLQNREEMRCVIDTIARGLVRVYQLDFWADAEGLTAEDGARQLEALVIEPLNPGESISRVSLETLKRKKQPGQPIYELMLPDMAIYALFDQGQGPMAIRKGRREGNSGKVLLASFDGFFELWGQAAL